MLRSIVWGLDKRGAKQGIFFLESMPQGLLWFEGERTKVGHYDLRNLIILQQTVFAVLPFSKKAPDSIAFVAATETLHIYNKNI